MFANAILDLIDDGDVLARMITNERQVSEGLTVASRIGEQSRPLHAQSEVIRLALDQFPDTLDLQVRRGSQVAG